MSLDDKKMAISGIVPDLDAEVARILPGRSGARVAPTPPASKSGRRGLEVAAMVAPPKAHPVGLVEARRPAEYGRRLLTGSVPSIKVGAARRSGRVILNP